jgi:hypothetical protein
MKGSRQRRAYFYAQCAYRFMKVFGFDDDIDPQVTAWKGALSKRLSEFLTTCDGCVRYYHMDRKRFLVKDLQE